MNKIDVMTSTDDVITVDTTTDTSTANPLAQDFADNPPTSTRLDDTIHYISPASPLSSLSRYEGGYSDIIPGYLRYTHDWQGGDEQPYVCSAASSESAPPAEIERTIAIIRPNAMAYEDVVVRKILYAGFEILGKRTLHLTPEQVSELYSEYYGSPSFPYMVVNMSAGPVLVMCLTTVQAVDRWKNLVGPTQTLHAQWFWPRSMRLRFGLHGSMHNALHASQNLRSAEREVRFFFPESILEPLLADENRVADFLNLYVNPTLLDGLTELCKKKPVDPIMFLAEWLLLNNPYQPKMVHDIAMLPT